MAPRRRGRPVVAESRPSNGCNRQLVTAYVVTFRYVLYVVGLVVGALLAWIWLLATPMEDRYWSCMQSGCCPQPDRNDVWSYDFMGARPRKGLPIRIPDSDRWFDESSVPAEQAVRLDNVISASTDTSYVRVVLDSRTPTVIKVAVKDDP